MVPLLGCLNLPSKAKEGRRVVRLCDEFVPARDVIFERARSLLKGDRGWPMEDALEPTTPRLPLRRGEAVQAYLANWLTVSAAATSGNET